MVDVKTIATMTTEEVKSNFFALMSEVITTYGDNQEKTNGRPSVESQQVEEKAQ